MPAPRHILRTHVRATADQVWQAITDPAFTERYFHHTTIESTWQVGAGVRYLLADGTEAVVGEIEVVDPPRHLVMTWRALYDATMAEEPPSRVEWFLDESDGITTVTTIHRDLAFSPATSASVGTGWVWILGSMKSLLETGEPLPGDEPELRDIGEDGDQHRAMGMDANNSAWELLGREDALTPDEADELLGRVYAAAHHWRRASRRGPENAARASWLISRAHAVLGHGDLALHHADQCMAVVAANDLGDFDLAYAHEARARALACLGRLDEAAVELAAARAVPIADDEDRQIVEGDLAAGPWYGLAAA